MEQISSDQLHTERTLLRPEVMFVCFALVFGLGFTFFNAPFQAPDEGAHFWRAYHVYQGDWVSTRKGNAVGGQIPKSVAYARQPYQHLISKPQERVNMGTLAADLNRPFEPKKTVFIDFFTPALFAPIVYIPQTIGIAIARAFDLSALKVMYAGRISTLLCCIAVLYAAIRIVPLFKWLFVLVALLPRSLFQSASLSADGPTNAIALLLTAFILQGIFGPTKQLGKWNILLILILSMLLSMSKQVYLPLVGLVFLIPFDKFGGWKQKLVFCALVVGASVLATGIWSMLIRDFYRPWKEANAPEQMALVMARPWIFPKIAVDSFLHYWPSLVFSFVGVLGFLDVWLPKWIYFTYPFLLIGVAVFDKYYHGSLNWIKRSWIILICLGVFLLIELSMYLVWTKPGAEIVEGVHGRYFIPLIIPALLAIAYSQRFRFLNKSLVPLGISIYSFIVLTASCWAVYARYYGPVS